jgi:hypothetical protein
MKIPMDAVTLLSVLFVTSSVLATAADDTQQQDRQLGPKKKKKLKKIFKNIVTKKLRIVLDSSPIVLAAVAGGGPGEPGEPSFIGSRSVLTGRAFSRSSVTTGGEAGDNTSEIVYTQICTVTAGSFPAIDTNSCDFSLCFTEPLIGGCDFYKSGGNFPFNFSTGMPPPVTATKTGGTGVFGFDAGSSFFILSSPGSGQVLDLDLTILPRENTKRNKILANTVPGESISY